VPAGRNRSPVPTKSDAASRFTGINGQRNHEPEFTSPKPAYSFIAKDLQQKFPSNVVSFERPAVCLHAFCARRKSQTMSNFTAKAISNPLYLPDSTGYILTLAAHSSTLALSFMGATEAMEYKIGDKVVYPNHGVGVVEQISYGVLNGRTERYFMIRIISSGLRVMVPSSNAPAVGLRSVIRSIDATKVLGFLEKGKLNSHHDWKHRFKENSERMRTGSLLEVAVVLKSLVSLSRSKPLSFREKKMLERAKYLLVSEMATARNLTAENAEGLVVKSLAKAKLQFPTMQEKVD
jgi:CarD family transcriptional regulator